MTKGSSLSRREVTEKGNLKQRRRKKENKQNYG
jgi:hypothetical protein